MMPRAFCNGDWVEIVGPSKNGYRGGIGERFVVSQNENWQYSAEEHPWYPASSLRLVDELKVGDYAEVLVSWCGVKKGTIIKISRIMEERIPGDVGPYYTADRMPLWPAHELRKLTPEEVHNHLAMSATKPGVEKAATANNVALVEDIQKLGGRLSTAEARLSVIESRLGGRLSSVEARLSAIEFAAHCVINDSP